MIAAAIGIRRFTDPERFLEVVGPLLFEEEDVNNLPLAVVQAQVETRQRGFPIPRSLLGFVGPEDNPDAVLVMTPPFPLLLTRVNRRVGLEPEIAAAVATTGFPVHGVLAEDDIAKRFASAWSARNEVPVIATVQERLHRADRILPVDKRPGQLRVAGPEDFATVLHWSENFGEEPHVSPSDDLAHRVGIGIEQGTIYLWDDDGTAMGMASVSRRTASGACLSGVFTPPEFRERGVATSLVSSLTGRMLQEIDFCVLHTDRGNTRSEGIYARIGYNPIQNLTMHRFEISARQRADERWRDPA